MVGCYREMKRRLDELKLSGIRRQLEIDGSNDRY